MKRALMLVLIFGFAGCRSIDKLLGTGKHENKGIPCSFQLADGLTDAEVMDALTPDQRNWLDNTWPWYDGRPNILNAIDRIYHNLSPYNGFACMTEADFKRAVEASVHLGRLAITL